MYIKHSVVKIIVFVFEVQEQEVGYDSKYVIISVRASLEQVEHLLYLLRCFITINLIVIAWFVFLGFHRSWDFRRLSDSSRSTRNITYVYHE